MKKKGVVQSHTRKGNTFQRSSMARNTHNNLLDQELRKMRRFTGFKKVLPCSEPCQKKTIRRWIRTGLLGLLISSGLCVSAYATPSTHIWAPSTDIQSYGKIHITADYYFPTAPRDHAGNRTFVQQVYGPTFSLLSDKPEENLLGKLWAPLGKVMAEAGFDYKKGLGSTLDDWPLYAHFKFAVPENAYFENMPAFAFGAYDMGYKRNFTNNNIWYFKAAKTISLGELNLGRFSAGYFNGNSKTLLDENGRPDDSGPMLAWERVMSEISDKLWICVDYQGTRSSYGAMNYGFSWKFNNNVSVILGYDKFNNPDLRDTITLQFDIDF